MSTSEQQQQQQQKQKQKQQQRRRPPNRQRGRRPRRGGSNDGDGPLQSTTALPPDEEVEIEEVDDHHHQYCLVCYTSALGIQRGIAPCGHNDVCAPCHLRLRSLHSDRKCPVCKTTNDTIIVDRDQLEIEERDADDGEMVHHKNFGQYQLWGEELGAGWVFRDDVGMHFRDGYYSDRILPLFSLACGVRGCEFTNDGELYVTESKFDLANPKARQKRETKRLAGADALYSHLRTEHNVTLCNLCVEFKRDFVSQLPRFTPSQLKHHHAKGDGEGSGFDGHPLCEFCKPKRFYDLTKLHEHLNKEHYKCHVCDKQGKPNQFFKNYDKLSLHFDRDHFLCHDPQCLAARFVVFENEIDLRAHEHSVHGDSHAGGSTKIQLEFRVRRSGYDGGGYENQEVPTGEDFQYGLDGEAFVPDALPNQHQENEPEISHPLHAERTAALRAEAARIRSQHDQQDGEEAFPTLGASASAGSGEGAGGGRRGNGMLVGWTAGGRAGLGKGKTNRVGTVTEDDFPSLSASNPLTKVNSIATRARAPRAGGALAATERTTQVPSGRSCASSANVQRRPPPVGMTSSTATSASVFTTNRTSDLTPDNFPSLGGGSGPRGSNAAMRSGGTYAAAEAFSRKRLAKTTTQGSGGPSLTNVLDFPPPPTSSGNVAAKKKQQVVVGKKAPSKQALDNVLQFPSLDAQPTDGKAMVDSMKSKLGSTKYKKLKSLTKEFASDNLDPELFVYGAMELFDDGVHDEDFWTFVPGLISSCPNQRSSKKAIECLESLRLANDMQGVDIMGSSSGSSSNNGWVSATVSGSGAGQNAFQTRPGKSNVSASFAGANSQVPPPVPYSGRGVIAGEKKNVWNGAGGESTAVRAKAPPGSVAAFDAQEKVQTGTATKYMAQARGEERKQKQIESQQKQGGGAGPSKKSKQKKKNEELRALAFGGK